MNKIIVATGNEHKMQEIRRILSGVDTEFVSLKEAGLSDIEIVEDGKTFVENAIIKAKTVSDATKKMVIADDSGLEVDYMDGGPGVYSARFLGEDTPYTIKNKYIIDKLEKAKGDERSARFVCAVACALPDGRCYTVTGTIEGQIAYEEKGENGFGYDPIFYVPEYGCTTAELPPDEKNKISHRGKALTAMSELLREKGLL